MNSKADIWFSKFVRIRDCNKDRIGTCVTCGKMEDVKYSHCGHFIGRQHKATRFSEMNGNIQCVNCNTFNEGRKERYERYLIDRYGQDKVDLLKMQGNSTRKISKFELEQIAKYYKSEAEKLAKQKNIQIW